MALAPPLAGLAGDLVEAPMPDPTLELLRAWPRETVSFLRVLLGFGTITSMGTLAFSLPAVWGAGDPWGFWWVTARRSVLSTAMTWWLGAVCAVQLVQLPLRMHLAWRLNHDAHVAVPRARVVRAMTSLLTSLEWRVNKAFGSCCYWFLITGSCLASYAQTWAEDVSHGAAAAMAAAATHAPLDATLSEVLEGVREGAALAFEGDPGDMAGMLSASHDTRLVQAVLVAVAALGVRLTFSFAWFYYTFIQTDHALGGTGPNARAATDETIAQRVIFRPWVPPATPLPDAPVTQASPPSGEATTAPCATDATAADATTTCTHEACCMGSGQERGLRQRLHCAATTPTSTSPSPSLGIAALSPSPATTTAAGTAEAEGRGACAICLTEYEPGVLVAQLPCSPLHVFHAACARQWLKVRKTCPLCTVDIDVGAVEGDSDDGEAGM